MSSKKKNQLKSLECHKKYFHLRKKKKKAQTESSLLPPPAQCLDKDLQITAELTVFEEELALYKLPWPEILGL